MLSSQPYARTIGRWASNDMLELECPSVSVQAEQNMSGFTRWHVKNDNRSEVLSILSDE